MTNLIKLFLFCFILSGCAPVKKNYPVDFREWEVRVISPSFYPVIIDELYGINEEEDWTMYVRGFGHHTWANSELDNAKKKIPDYDGFGIPLHIISSTRGSQNGIKTLPESIYVYWASLAEGKYYVNKFDLTSEMREAMMFDHPQTRTNGSIRHCYQKNIVLGLLPGGTAKVWSLGCDQYTYLGKVEPEKEFDEFGHNKDYYNIKKEQTEKRAADNGVDLFPIPYDKVDQVFEYVPIPRCSNKALWGCS